MVSPSRFNEKKEKILKLLDTPAGEYHDLSPKGSVDEPIRSLISDINSIEGLVTTSSCSGRISVFLEGKKRHVQTLDAQHGDEGSRTSPGGKGGGSWLFISHSRVEVPKSGPQTDLLSKFGIQRSSGTGDSSPTVESSYIHLKFEPMILHILTASLEYANRVLTVGLHAGFRESGAVSLSPFQAGELNPMVAIRSTGYSFDAIIGYQDRCGSNIALVDNDYLRTLVDIANERFKINSERIARFSSFLLKQRMQSQSDESPSFNVSTRRDWEDADVRRRRKREEGLTRQRALQKDSSATSTALDPESVESVNINGLFS
ncbi:hypothetical protein CC78DRAFT_544989 [Lojkania enalia]|uniref:tRNA(Phe) 7-[(3-amino-3-carboxypropyl)-4-demethylwyosine(37)-N(4)]-methyltransferase n=1 Tax=Lojkania enalia TaxID=147567 RepID=A0A9P4N5J8_9PLEO|nr:hypothetical protein CC78DRAFT_544989 [Didymosphaeria enalia]